MQIVIIPVLDGAFHHGIIRRPPRPRRPRGRVGGGLLMGTLEYIGGACPIGAGWIVATCEEAGKGTALIIAVVVCGTCICICICPIVRPG